MTLLLRLRRLITNDRFGKVLMAVAIVAAAALIFAARYLPAFRLANFSTEDGTVYLNNIFSLGYVHATLVSFNGYLIVGQYLLLDLAVMIYHLLGLHFYQLPLVIAGLSCLFLGLTAALPFLLFRKQLGTLFGLVAVVIGCFVALPDWEYTVIGTIGNLKFAFMYWAFLFVLYRNSNLHSRPKVITSDLMVLLSVATYVPSVAVLPFALIPYVPKILASLRSRRIGSLLNVQFVSLLTLGLLSAVYLLLVKAHGIPKMPGYLDTPYIWDATLKIVYRVTLFTFTYPLKNAVCDATVCLLLAGFLWTSLYRNKRHRPVIAFGLWMIFVATLSFVANRPGVSIYFVGYNPDPDQFFFGQTLIFGFVVMWLLAHRPSLRNNYKLVVPAVIIFLLCSAPFGTSRGKSVDIYRYLGTARQNVARVCRPPIPSNQLVTIHTYPTPHWDWTLSKRVVCN